MSEDFPGSFFSSSFAIVDVETTGMGGSARVCEVGAATVKDGVITGSFNTLIDPCVPITNSNIHGITDSMVYGAPRFESVLPKLLEFTHGSIFCAHNAAFDIGMLVAEQKRMGAEPENKQPYVCSVVLGRVAFPGLGSYRLESLTTALEIENKMAHSGLADAYATAEALIELLARLKKMPTAAKLLEKRIIKHRPIFTGQLPLIAEKTELKPRDVGVEK